MYSFDFPSMLSTANSKLLKDKEAVRSNVLRLLESERKTLFGDPYFGTRLKRLLFEQASTVVADLVVDEIYTTLITFIPQISLTRNDIQLSYDGTNINAQITYVYVPDNTVDLYTISLTESET